MEPTAESREGMEWVWELMEREAVPERRGIEGGKSTEAVVAGVGQGEGEGGVGSGVGSKDTNFSHPD